jgi:tRNA 2-thiouridine synthesizing protein E
MDKITVTLADKTVEVDQEGFLENRSDWNEEIAKEMAKADGFELTPDHWAVIHFIREYDEEFHTSPPVCVLVKVMGKKLGPEKWNSKYLYELFPSGTCGPAHQARKYAGLRRPECIK